MFEKRILRMINSSDKDNGIWRTKYSNELYMLHDELDVVEVEKYKDCSGWDSYVECKNWILAEDFLYLNQKAPDM
jgi:hypothetical protein